ncbi:MAG: hypothetical protein PW788_10810 [Micavibrio sp.]|nr:hypothetical protein [Micavibrio sp.]
MSGWLSSLPQTAQLLLVGPVMQKQLTAVELAALDLAGATQVAVDGGINYAPAPHLWAGDGDSGAMPKNIPAYFKESQDLTDLRFCLGGLRDGAWTQLHLIGFLGARRDHELANLGEIETELKQRPKMREAVFYDDALQPALRFFQSGTHTVTLHGAFSLLVFSEAVINLSGACEYPASALVLPPLSGQGISNVGNGDINIHSTQPFLVILR